MHVVVVLAVVTVFVRVAFVIRRAIVKWMLCHCGWWGCSGVVVIVGSFGVGG